MKKLINNPTDVVVESLRGIVQLNPDLRLLEGSRTVVNANALNHSRRVSVISGGGAGHEPAHAGYVGNGMLSAAVSGDVFASPSVDEIVDAIRVAHAGAGVLLVVKNYTGDKLNFGLAAEIVRLENIEVEMVVVADDVALNADEASPGARGIAGTVFVHKVAGAAAAQGLNLREVAERARRAAESTATMGVALGPCVVPAAGSPSFELPPEEVEWGLGIHGEAGVERSAVVSASKVVDRLMSQCVDALGGSTTMDEGVALLVNNLGGSSAMEMAIIADEALGWANENSIEVKRIWAGTFLTAMEMPGCSISVMKLGPELVALLDAPAETFAWPASHLGRSSVNILLPRSTPEVVGSSDSTLAGATLEVVDGLLKSICALEPELTEMDQIVGDGDLGHSLKRGAEAIVEALPSMPERPDEMFRDMATIIRRAIGGTSGPLLSVMLLRMSEQLPSEASPTLEQWYAALASGVQGIQDLGGAQLGDRTMVDALLPAVSAFGAELNKGSDLPAVSDLLTQVMERSKVGAESTAEMVARKGRSSYIGDRALGHPDPGAWAVFRIFEALNDVLSSDCQSVR